MKLAVVALLLAARVVAANEENDLEVRKIADGVWVHTTIRVSDGVPANGLLVKRGDGLVLVDTPWNDDQTTRLLEWAQANLKMRVTSAVVTHSHADRTGGLGALHAAKITAVGLDVTAEKAKAENLPAPGVLLTRTQREREHEGLVVFYPGAGHTTDNIVVYVPPRACCTAAA